MPDYMNFLDLEAIECADTAFANNQFNVSSLLYGIAHRRLMEYPGDRMLPIQMAGELNYKLMISGIYKLFIYKFTKGLGRE